MGGSQTDEIFQAVSNVEQQLGVDLAATPITRRDILRGYNVELEHGLMYPATNVTFDGGAAVEVGGATITDTPAERTAKIALAHLLEKKPDGEYQYDYYDALEVMEESPSGFWRGREEGFWPRARVGFVLLVIILLIVLFAWGSQLAQFAVVLGVAYILFSHGGEYGVLV
jgi:hypothetical protein